jgi:signal transduction histidine kinase
MKTSLRSRLSISHLVVSLLGMFLAGILVWIAVERVYLFTQTENLLAQARLTATALEGTPVLTEEEEFYSQTTNISPGIHTRLLDESGAVLIGVPFPEGEYPVQVPADEDPGYVPAETLLQRPEIQAALSGKAETAIRQVDFLEGQRVLYAAAPVFDDQGQVRDLVYLATPLPRRGLPVDLTLQLAGAVIGGMTLAGLVGLLLAKRIAQPLETLDRAASAISAGKLSQWVFPPSGIEEVDNLSRSFNNMSSSLQFTNQAKNAFIADVTHELRTPLTVIKGSVETLEDGAVDDLEGRGRLLDSLGKETDRLIRLVNDLLTLTRADASALKLNIQPIDLVQLVRESCQTLEPLLTLKALQLSISPPQSENAPVTPVLADPDRVSQILGNILDNAIRYAPIGSEIRLFMKAAGEFVECSIEDQGPGVPPEHLPYIFERFYRADPARDRGSGGSGLGR